MAGCAGVDCGAHGSCSGGTCFCESEAYTGDRCQNDVRCFDVDCGAHGSCSGGTCFCENSGAYSGDRCQNYDRCFGVDCGAHGSCSGGTCTCESGAYSGGRCQSFGENSWATCLHALKLCPRDCSLPRTMHIPCMAAQRILL